MKENSNSIFFRNFNDAIDKVNREIQNDKYMRDEKFYKFIKNAMEMICAKLQYEKENSNIQIPTIQKDRMFEVIFDFFKSIDNELYEKAVNIMRNNYTNTKVHLYDYYKDDLEHLTRYLVYYREGKAIMFLPLRFSISKEEAELIDLKYGEDFCTIDDLYSIIHEISHLFDIKPENYTNQPTLTRDILTEVTPKIFEKFLSEYLLKNGIFDENVINNKKIKENNKLWKQVNLARIKLIFLEIKRIKGEITEDDIQEVRKNEILSDEEFENILNLIPYSDVSIIENKRYAFCEMYAPIIFEKCKSNLKLLKKYLNENSKNIPFTDILKGFGIDIKNKIEKLKTDEFER